MNDGRGGWYSIPMDEIEARALQRRAREWADKDDTPNLYALHLIMAIDEILYLRAREHGD